MYPDRPQSPPPDKHTHRRVRRRFSGCFASTLAICIALLCPLSISGATLQAVTGLNASPPTPLIVFIGDSLTKGYYASDQTHRFATLVGTALRRPIDVDGAYGYTAVETAQRMAATAARHQAVVPREAALVVIEFGTNDLADIANGQETLSAFTAAYTQLLGHVQDDAPTAAILCLGAWRSSTTTLRQLDQAIVSLCPGSFVRLDDLYATSGDRGPVGRATWLGVSDGFHPNDQGHAAIAARIVQGILST